MTDSSNPKTPKTSRKKPAREPATIDLKATVIDEGGQPEKAWDDLKPEETILPEPETRAEGSNAEAESTVASPEATLDSGAGADSIEPGASAEPPPPQDDAPGVVPPAAAPVPERRTSPAALFGAGLLGGLIGAGVVYGLQASQQSPSPQQDPRLAQLEQRVNALGQSRPPGADLPGIEGRLREIQAAADRAVARAEEAMNRPLPPSPAPQNEAALNDLSQRLAALESKDPSQRLSAIENEVRANAQNAATAATAVQALERRLAEQDQRLAALSQQLAESRRNAEAAGQTGTRVVLAERLGDALRSGTPFGEVLEGLRKTGTAPEKLTALEPFAEKGAPTAAAMLDAFEPLEAQILRDERAASGEWSDRLLRMVDKVVTVRPVNEPGATGVSATLARIRQALSQGDVGAAAAAWASLPEPARRMSEEWGRQITALAGAEQASREISGESLATLNRSTQ